VTCVMASTVKGEPATWAPWSVMATVWRPTSDQGTATLYAPPPSARDAAIARPHPLGPVGSCNYKLGRPAVQQDSIDGAWLTDGLSIGAPNWQLKLGRTSLCSQHLPYLVGWLHLTLHASELVASNAAASPVMVADSASGDDSLRGAAAVPRSCGCTRKSVPAPHTTGPLSPPTTCSIERTRWQ
jgi:hypothetical protein